MREKLVGIGNDIVEIERIRRCVKTYADRFLHRLFTQKEQDYCLNHKDPIPHLAGRFSAKEAITKALGTGIGEYIGWKDLEILNDAAGKPVVTLSAAVQEKLGPVEVMLSISHCKEYVTAVALVFKK